MSNEYIERETTDLRPSIPVFPNVSKRCVNAWIIKMRQGILSCTDFIKHWMEWAPKIYSPEPNTNCLGWSFDEDKAQKILYNTLEEFICNGDPQVILKQLSQMDNPPSVCGKVFKMGEPTYGCRECGVDATCVLCVDCFKQSTHSTHKYKMGTSNGGGCCDCGDTEAWKKDPFCKVHYAGLQSKKRRGNKLPGDIAERAVMTFEAVLRYCYEILSLERTSGLLSDLCVRTIDEDPMFLLDATDNYCTVLFNDETHTFEQVITTLTRVIKCSQRDAIEYVTIVDREGRAVVKCSEFRDCHDLKVDIERHTLRHNNGPLKVLVVHAHIIAHQMFAMKVLKWLQQFISVCEGFRVLFSNVALNTKLPDISIVEGILMRDLQLWKSARTAWHRLFISGMLMEYESKKALAIVFTRNYGSMMKDFIRDDHDYSFSIVSFSVQLFTVPTLTHHLIAHHDALFILLNTFISESSRRCNGEGKLEFERNALNASFKRALYILYDLKYLLSSKPKVWTDELRRGFLQGVSLLLTLFCSMQYMDPVIRQVGHHMEYEPEWESAFTLHMRLSPIVSLAVEWCGSDRVVLIKAFRLVLKKLYEQPGNDNPSQVSELADHSATCLQYDVRFKPVSIHLPLCRFLAGLFLHLEKHNLHFQCPEFINETKPTPEQIIDPVLIAQAMISQLHAGMWRRNGHSLVNQVFFYQSVKCRAEMLDRDIVLLQAGASLIESNEFLIHLLNKFNLFGWASPYFESTLWKNCEEDSIRQTTNLVEEFLGLLITIIGERYVPGVGQVTPEDHLKKEIIQQLCIRPLSHSELNKALQEDVHQELGLDSVIKDIADFVTPSQKSANKGFYKLKPHLYTEYNVFFYHYTKEESSRSEEVQRKYRKSLGELECCPPPKLPKLTDTFSLVANLLQCDVMLYIMKTVLERTHHFTAKSFSEMQVHKVLHLIGYALQEQQSGHYPFLTFTERANKWELYKLLSSLTNNPRIEAHKDLLSWILSEYREVGCLNTPDLTVSPPAPRSENNADVQTDKEWRKKMAADKRAKIMAEMAAMQKYFMKKNAKLFEETTLAANKISDHGTAMDLSDSDQEACVALGINQTSRLLEELTFTCILCQENQAITTSGPAMVLAAFVQQSTVLCQTRPDTEEPEPLYLSAKLGATPHTSTCSHVMHVRCWEDYFDNVQIKESRRPYRLRQPASFDMDKQEYLCPLCECLSNTVIPLLPPLGVLQPKPQIQSGLSFGLWLDALRLTIDRKSNKKTYEPQNLKEEYGPECRFCANIGSQEDRLEEKCSESSKAVSNSIRIIHHELGDAAIVFDSVYGKPGPSLSEGLVSMIQEFAQATYTKGLGVRPHGGNSRVPLLAWKSTAYTVHAIEFLLRDQEKPLLCALSSRQKDCLIGLTKISAILGSTCFSNSSVSSTWANRKTVANHAVSLLTMLLDNPHTGASILDWDAFGVLIPLINSLPCLFSSKSHGPPPLVTCGVLEYYALQLVFIALIVKILLTFDFNETMDVAGTQEPEKSNADSILTMVQALEIDIGNQTVAELWKRVKEACMPFLRCCALYFHYASDVPAPASLKTTEGATYENICSYLGLPVTCDDLIKPNLDIISKLIGIWKSHPAVQMHLSAASTVVAAVKEPLKINKLVELPEDYSELINSISMFTCPNNDREDSRNPTMCLVCGEMLCSQSYCCQAELKRTMVGACTYHASKCGAGVGIFLRVRECEVLFLRSPNRGAFVSPPYLDEYGETDQGLRRGNPLRFCRERYKQLNETWLAHELHEYVARTIESANNLVSTQWHHL